MPDRLNRLEVLESLLRRYLELGRADFSAWGQEPDFPTAATYFVLDLAAGQGVEPFVTFTLGRLLQQLSRTTLQLQAEYHGQVRGRVLWEATHKARYTESYDPNLFVCREVHQRYDTPENQLLKYMLLVIDECLKAVPPEIRQGNCYLPQRKPGGFTAGLETINRLGSMEATIHRLQRSVRLIEIEAPSAINEYHLLRARTSRLEEYAEVAFLYDQYKRLVLQRSWNTLVESGHRVLPLPDSPNGQGERWVGLAATILRSR
jgi:hypothetical protein